MKHNQKVSTGTIGQVMVGVTPYAPGVAKILAVDTFGNAQVAYGDGASIDAFGRARVAQPYTLFDSKQILDNQPLFWDDQQVSGAGTTSTWSKDRASSVLKVSALTAGRRIRQTYQRMNYQPGKSLLVVLTGVMGSPEDGVTRFIGYGDDLNGIFFTLTDTLNVVLRSGVSGVAVDTIVPQAQWNIDALDGTGLSGFKIDPAKANIYGLDLEWLGVGRVRLGLVIDGLFKPCHQFLNANNLTSVYMSTPNLPLRYEIENDASGAEATLEHICSTAISEGGLELTGSLRYASTTGTEVTCTTENVTYAIVGIRKKATHVGSTVLLNNIALQIQNATKQCEWYVVFNPSVVGTFTYGDVTNSSVQVALGATANTVTGGTIITGGFIESSGAPGGASGSADRGILTSLRLGASIAGVSDTIVLCATPRGGTSGVAVEGSLTWRELD